MAGDWIAIDPEQVTAAPIEAFVAGQRQRPPVQSDVGRLPAWTDVSASIHGIYRGLMER